MATALAHLQDEAPELDEQVPPGVRGLVMRMIARIPARDPWLRGGRPSVASGGAAAATARGRVLPPAPSPTAVLGSATPIWRSPALRSRRLQIGAAAVVATLVALTAFVAARPSTTMVPDLRGQTASEAAPSWRPTTSRSNGTRSTTRPRTGHRAGPGSGSGAEADGDSVVVIDVASGRTSFDAVRPGRTVVRRRGRALVGLGLVPARRDVERPGGDGTVVTAKPVGRLPLGTTRHPERRRRARRADRPAMTPVGPGEAAAGRSRPATATATASRPSRQARSPRSTDSGQLVARASADATRYCLTWSGEMLPTVGMPGAASLTRIPTRPSWRAPRPLA